MVAGGVVLEVGCPAFEQGGRPGGVAPSLVRQADAELRQALPQGALLGRPSLPTGFEDLVGGEGPALPDQLASPLQGLGRPEGGDVIRGSMVIAVIPPVSDRDLCRPSILKRT